MFCDRTSLHCDEKQAEDENKKSVGERDKFSSRHACDGGGEGDVRNQHRDERRGEHPWQCLHVARANAVTDGSGNVVSAQDEEIKHEPEPEGARLCRLDVNDAGLKGGQEAFQLINRKDDFAASMTLFEIADRR